MKLKDYQVAPLASIIEKRAKGGCSALLVMAPGLGKTIISAFDVKIFLENHGGRVLYLCHTNEVLAQAKSKYESVLGKKYSLGFYNGIEKAPDADIVFASFQAMHISGKNDFGRDDFAYIIDDEAHHAPAITYTDVLEYFEPEFLLGLTATPYRLDGQGLEDIFGPITYNLDIVEAIAGGLTPKIDYYVELDEMQDVESVFVEGEKVSISELNRRLFIPKRDEEIVEIITEKMDKVSGKSAMIFCRSIEHAERIAALLPNAVVVHSGLSNKECKNRLNLFREGNVRFVVSVDMLNEGIDVPHADVIVFLRSTVSPVVFHQQLGRGLRTSHGKKRAIVLDFVCSFDRLQIIGKLVDGVNTIGSGAEDDALTLHLEGLNFHEKKLSLDVLLKSINVHTWYYTKEELIIQLQGLANRLGHTPTHKEFNTDPDCASAYSAQKAFGSWNNFLLAAGFQPNKEHKKGFTKEDLNAQLQDLAKRLGHTPTQKEFKTDPDCASAYNAQKAFGSWNNFLLAAGFQPNSTPRKAMRGLTKEDLIVQLQVLAKRLGRTPIFKEFRADPDCASVGTAAKAFGSWNNFLLAAGFQPNSTPRKAMRGLTKEDLIVQFQNLANQLGHTPTIKEFNADPDCASVDTAAKAFGSWNNFLLAAGFQPNSTPRKAMRGLSKEELIVQFQNLANQLGHTPTIKEFNADPDCASVDTAAKAFGSWNNFLLAAGFQPNSTPRKAMRGLSKEELIVQFQNLANQLGHTPTIKEFGADPDCASVAPVVNRFGSWNNFLLAAGFQPNMKKKK